MTQPTDENHTGVESYDHSAVVQLPEYHEARKALDALVHAMNRAELEVGQAAFLQMVEQMAASLSYSDSSGHPRNTGCAGEAEGAWPHIVQLDEDEGSLRGTYRCAACGREWQTGYAVNIGDFV
jgi:hypothetical protein